MFFTYNCSITTAAADAGTTINKVIVTAVAAENHSRSYFLNSKERRIPGKGFRTRAPLSPANLLYARFFFYQRNVVWIAYVLKHVRVRAHTRTHACTRAHMCFYGHSVVTRASA